MPKKIVFLLIIAIGLLWQSDAVFSVANNDSWTNLAGDAARTGSSSNNLPDLNKILWQLSAQDLKQQETSGNGRIYPIIADNKVFINYDKIMALDLTTGKILWTYADKTQPFFPSGTAYGVEKIYAVINDSPNLKEMKKGKIIALSADQGKLLWQADTGNAISHSQPLYYQQQVYIGDDSSQVYSFSAESGKLLWKTQLDAEVIHSSPAYYQNNIYIGTEGSARSKSQPSSFYALDAKEGKIIWRSEIDYVEGAINLIHSTPSILDGIMYGGSENGWFYALDSDSGKLKWKKRLVESGGVNGLLGTSAPIAVANGKIFLSTWSNNYFALNIENGDIVWKTDNQGEGSDQAPLAAQDKICFSAHNANLSCYSQENGKLAGSKNLIGAQTALANNILIATNSSELNDGNNGNVVIAAFSNQGNEKLKADANNSPQKNQLPPYLLAIFSAIGIMIITIVVVWILEKRKLSRTHFKKGG